MIKPIKIFRSGLSGHYYATQYYKEENGIGICTGKKFDVTDQIKYYFGIEQQTLDARAIRTLEEALHYVDGHEGITAEIRETLRLMKEDCE